jgi:hypothetical protein
MSMNGSLSGEALGRRGRRRLDASHSLRWRGLCTLLAVLTWVAVLGGCAEHGGRFGIEVVNDLGIPVEIAYLAEPEVMAGRLGTEEGDDREVFDFGLNANPSAPPSQMYCTTADIIARSLDGRVLARIPPPACDLSTLLLSSFPAP